MPKKTFSAGDILTAADVNTYLMNQAVMTFADSTARGSAIGTAVEGMLTYLEDTNAYEYWDGAAYVALVDIPTPTTPTNSTVTTAYTAVVGNAGGFLYSTSSSAITVTFPDLYSIGDRVDVIRDGAGTVTIAAGTGVTGWGGAGTAGTAVTFKIDERYNAATVLKVAANTYRVVGKITV
jgi:hypothetical protein